MNSKHKNDKFYDHNKYILPVDHKKVIEIQKQKKGKREEKVDEIVGSSKGKTGVTN